MIKMKAIDYNLWMTLLKLVTDSMPAVMTEYGISNRTVAVKPSYPRDLSDLCKPSIIIRKVDTLQSKLSMDGFIGQYYDPDIHGYIDVKAVEHRKLIQFDIISDSNFESSLMISAFSEGILNKIVLESQGRFKLYDFTANISNPVEIGVVSIIGLPRIKDIGSVEQNNDYISTLRCDFSIVQTITQDQEFVDLSKWIKQTYTIKI